MAPARLDPPPRSVDHQAAADRRQELEEALEGDMAVSGSLRAYAQHLGRRRPAESRTASPWQPSPDSRASTGCHRNRLGMAVAGEGWDASGHLRKQAVPVLLRRAGKPGRTAGLSPKAGAGWRAGDAERRGGGRGAHLEEGDALEHPRGAAHLPDGVHGQLRAADIHHAQPQAGGQDGADGGATGRVVAHHELLHGDAASAAPHAALWPPTRSPGAWREATWDGEAAPSPSQGAKPPKMAHAQARPPYPVPEAAPRGSPGAASSADPGGDSHSNGGMPGLCQTPSPEDRHMAASAESWPSAAHLQRDTHAGGNVPDDGFGDSRGGVALVAVHFDDGAL